MWNKEIECVPIFKRVRTGVLSSDLGQCGTKYDLLALSTRPSYPFILPVQDEY